MLFPPDKVQGVGMCPDMLLYPKAKAQLFSEGKPNYYGSRSNYAELQVERWW